MKGAALLLTCKDAPRVTNLTAGEVSKMMAQLASYYLQQSDGRERLEYQVFDRFGLSLTSDEWNTLAFNVGPMVVAAVAAKLPADLSSFDHFVLVIDKASTSSAATDPATLKFTHASARDLTQAILTHEFGHSYGANYASLQTPSCPQEYGDGFCVMGAEVLNTASTIQTLASRAAAVQAWSLPP